MKTKTIFISLILLLSFSLTSITYAQTNQNWLNFQAALTFLQIKAENLKAQVSSLLDKSKTQTSPSSSSLQNIDQETLQRLTDDANEALNTARLLNQSRGSASGNNNLSFEYSHDGASNTHFTGTTIHYDNSDTHFGWTDSHSGESDFHFLDSYAHWSDSEKKQYDSLSQTTQNLFTRDLRQGDQNEDVRELQRFLNQNPSTKVAQTGAGSLGNETSFYGRLTEAAVVKFQQEYNLPITGVFDTAVRNALNALTLSGGNNLPSQSSSKFKAKRGYFVGRRFHLPAGLPPPPPWIHDGASNSHQSPTNTHYENTDRHYVTTDSHSSVTDSHNNETFWHFFETETGTDAF